MRWIRRGAWLALLLNLASCRKPAALCGPDNCPGQVDSGSGPDSGLLDAGSLDSGLADAGGLDAGTRPSVWTNIGIGTPVQLAQDGGPTPSFGGRVNALRVAQATPDLAFLGTAGGGIWRSADFTAPTPHWQPLTDSLAHLSVSALDLDAQHPGTLYAAMGDLDGFFITIHGVLMKSTDNGATFLPPISVVDSVTGAHASILYDVRVDPLNSQILLVGTDVGLFRSEDAGGTFSLMTLPNAGSLQVTNAIHNIAFVGSLNGNSRWVVSGVYACDVGVAPPTFVGSPSGANCPVGNQGDLWRSRDAGKTWTSMRANILTNPLTFPGWSQLADASTTDGATGLGRMILATNATSLSDPGASVVYALALSIDAHASVDVLRSVDGGQTWASIWVGAQGSLSNPSGTCGDIGVAQHRTGAIAVDPTDSNQVLIGGTVCALRTLSGLGTAPVWDNVMNATHADWRTAGAYTVGGVVFMFSGNDGGLYLSTNLFSTPQGSESAVLWTPANAGLFAELTFALGSGDPADGNSASVLAGFQDIGAFINDADGGWDSVGGGDASAAVVNGSVSWWGAEIMRYCEPSASDCRIGANWTTRTPAPPAGDTLGLAAARYSPLLTDRGGRVLLNSRYNIWLSTADFAQTWIWTPLTASNLPAAVTNLFASPTSPGLFAAALDDGTCAVTGNGLDAAPSWTVSQPLGDATGQLPHASMVAFSPVTQPGTLPGDVYLASSRASALASGAAIPDPLGHLFITHDRGATWQPFHGDGLGSDLPNLPISVVRYDASDPTGSRIYVATQNGLYRSLDGGMTWGQVGVLPSAPVTDLFVSRDGTLVRVSTLGRGVWELSPGG